MRVVFIGRGNYKGEPAAQGTNRQGLSHSVGTRYAVVLQRLAATAGSHGWLRRRRFTAARYDGGALRRRAAA
ncbi:hypothetical protein [Actinobaculum suis]|uniref:hypothetical protein n=1 Tax=Actinobaculum suis TaxID=1657 RepID=UPI0008087CCB|nr:hypothetical protein [Actinobaculum suis]OCA95536.1 hypothetical protein ACU20_03935 [Actinobaculum suis]